MLHTAGKITITMALAGTFILLLVFLLDIGKKDFTQVSAQTATTSVQVLNFPPAWVDLAYEVQNSSTTNPINSGQQVTWRGTAEDQDGGVAPYFLLLCSNSTPPQANSASSTADLGTAPPQCVSGTQWAVSAATPSGEEAEVSVTTTESNPFGESNNWYAWVCDDDPVNPRCNDTFSQGDARGASPFVVNRRPVLTSVSNNGPTLPGQTITFTSVSSDPDILRGADNLVLHVCSTNSFTNATCDGETLATTSSAMTTNATASFEITIPTQNREYDAFVFLVDEFDHVANNNFQSNYTVANATPEVVASSISINGGNDITLLNAGTTTPGYLLEFTVTDNNSCVALDPGDPTQELAPGSEFADVFVSLYRSGVGFSGSTACRPLGTSRSDANNCYQSLNTSWNIACQQVENSCTDNTDVSTDYTCTFELAHIADPTDGATTTEVQFPDENWRAAVAVVDIGNATSTPVEGDTGVEMIRLLAFDLATPSIPYPALEPGQQSDIEAATNILATGNVGINPDLQGSDMCVDFSPGSPCAVSATSTIPADQQRFAASTGPYTSGNAISLSSTVSQVLELNIPKTTSLTTLANGNVYWGIAIPSTITQSGAYTGQNEFAVVQSDATNW